MRIPGEKRRAAGPARDAERSSFPRAPEPCGPLCEGDGSAAEAGVAERDGACGTVLVHLNTEVWRWETNTPLLAGSRRSSGK